GAFGRPVVGPVAVAGRVLVLVLERGAGRSRRLDEPAQLARVLAATARRGLHAGRDVDAPGPDVRDRLGDVVEREPTGEEETNVVQRAVDLHPVEHTARAWIRGVDQHDV